MLITEFIVNYYPISEKLKEVFSNPYQAIENANDLPYDKIGPDEDGNITKLVVIDETRTISVLDLICLTPADLSRDSALKEIYDIYMEQITLQDVNIADIMESVSMYKNSKATRQEQSDVLRL